MPESDTPAKVATSAGLGPLPEPHDPPVFGYTSADMRAYAAREVAAERERGAMKLNATRADVSLAVGEMSAQEWRTCAAVLRWMQGRIRRSA